MPLFPILSLLLFILNTLMIGILIIAISAPTIMGNETDRLALFAVKSKITHDPQGVLSSWNESIDFCMWEGVTCGQRHKRVTALNLTAKSLAGSLSPFIGNLSFLHELRLMNNTFSGHIPPEIGRLFRLQILVLSGNSFEGEIPENISSCLQLKLLGLASNKLIGTIPSQFSFLSKLRILGLSFNNLTGDDLFPLSNLTSLNILLLSDQIYQGGVGFQGSIPDFIGKMKDLRILSLGGNSFTGKIPSSAYNLTKMQEFSIYTNQLEGSLPPDFGFYFPQLQWLEIYNNQLSGPIPFSLSNLTYLKSLDISNNNFNGEFYLDGNNMKDLARLSLNNAILESGDDNDLKFLDSLVNCSQLEILQIRGNYFGGLLPLSIANLSTKLVHIDLANNLISGPIPLGLGKFINLRNLYLYDNHFTGTIPAEIGNIPSLQRVIISNNRLSGSIPLSLGNLSWLTHMDLSLNQFQGSIPTTLGNCKNLLGLSIKQNNISGNVPYQLFQASSLVELYLDHNHLQGSLPLEVGNLKSLVILDMSSNNLSGSIPSSLSQCVALTNLSLRGNSFVGFIPASFSLLIGLQFLDLSSNNLYGQVPSYFSNFSSLTLLNLSFNNFEGEVPTNGVFANLSAISIIANKNLCGGIPELELPSCPTAKSRPKKKSRAIVIAVSISSVLVGLVILYSIYLLSTRRRSKTSSTELSLKKSFIKVSYDMLLKATDGFSSEKLIGSGSFGSVYKGTLLLDKEEKVVAIKVIKNQRQGASKSFIAECEALRIIRHRNLVGILTACSSIDYQGNVFKALVYELMSKGSLDRWLHSNQEDDDQFQNLSLLQRLNIAIDVAHALDYIHNGNDIPVIHCDLKPTNILLDEDMTAHVGDFGLVKLIPEISEQLHNSSSVGVRGTVGYAAPEYGLGASVSTTGDLYSYGIILLEMMTAKKPTDLMFAGDMSLHKFAEAALADHMLEIVDPKLLLDDGEERNIQSTVVMKCTLDCITSIIMIGVRCSSELPQDRMDIKNVIRQLQSQRDNLHLCKRQHRCQHIL